MPVPVPPAPVSPAASTASAQALPTATLKAIYRHPVKGLSPEALDAVTLEAGAFFPNDRLYAVENGPSGFDPDAPAYRPKTAFLMLMRDARLAGEDVGQALQLLGRAVAGQQRADQFDEAALVGDG